MYSIVVCMTLTGAAETPDIFFRRHGCGGGCFGGWGGGCRGGFGCWGGRHWGCGGGYACNGGYTCCGGTVTTHAKEEVEEEADSMEDESTTQASAPARIVVSVPAGAQLIVNDRITQSQGKRRSFVTSNLLPGRTYDFRLTVSVNDENGARSASKTVRVRAGERKEVKISLPKTALSQR